MEDPKPFAGDLDPPSSRDGLASLDPRRAQTVIRSVQPATGPAHLNQELINEISELRSQLREANSQLDRTTRRLVYLETELARLLQKHSALLSSISWRVTKPLRFMRAKAGLSSPRFMLLQQAFHPQGAEARRILLASLRRRAGLTARTENSATTARYADNGIAGDLNSEDRELITAQVAKGALPSMSALIFATGIGSDDLIQIVEALDRQIVPVRQIVIVVPANLPDRKGAEELARQRSDVVIVSDMTVPTAGVVEAGALLVLSSTSMPREHATAVLASEMQARAADIVYADEVFTSSDGEARTPFYKPDYAPRLAASSDYLGHCALIRLSPEATQSSIAEIIAGVASSDSVSSYLTKRCADTPKGRVQHAPFVIVEESDPRRKRLPLPRERSPASRDSTVAILIPTRDRLSLLRPCIESIVAKTDYPRDAYEIIVIDNGSSDPETLRYLEEGASAGTFGVLRDNGVFNYARLNNLAARATTADVLVFLNNDTLIIQPDWLARLVESAVQDDVGMVGAKLLYEDGTVQHGGVLLGIQGLTAHADLNLPADDPGYHGLAWHDREISAVTGACMATRRDHFWSVGGFDENLAVAFNDILLCVTMLRAGFSNLQLNTVRVTHLESKSRGLDHTLQKQHRFLSECIYARERGEEWFTNDRYYSPNLSLRNAYQPASVPRRRKPWRSPAFRDAPRVLILGDDHEREHTVRAVIDRQASHMAELGWDVHVGGRLGATDGSFEDARADLESPVDALRYVAQHDIDIVIPHSAPYFSLAREAGPYPLVVACDHGSAPPYLFRDAHDQWIALQEKRFSLSLAHRVYALADSIREEAGSAAMRVMRFGNSHLPSWSPEIEARRARIRASRGWSDKVVVLHAGRFDEAERQVRGVDFFLDVARHAGVASASAAERIVFIQGGQADARAVKYVRSRGVLAFAEADDLAMEDLFAAADVFASFAQWDGAGHGVGQALALGLPIVASDILAHRRNYPDIAIAADPGDAWQIISGLADAIEAAQFAPLRQPHVIPWQPAVDAFTGDVLNLWRRS